MLLIILSIFSLNFIFSSSWISANADEIVLDSNSNSLRKMKLPVCQACRLFAESFENELKRVGDSVGGVNSIDREKEMIDILNKMCREDRAKDQCKVMTDKFKPDIERWWLYDRIETNDLFDYLCIKKLRYCCPNGHYGPECNPCPGYPDKVCSNNGKCKGNGTRKGSGDCNCDLGYVGELCDMCASTYYISYKDDNKLLCARCHAACDDNCTQAGARGCRSCREGWRMDKSKGCVDENECLQKRSPCKRNEFCVNNEGSFSCLACDPACDTCSGDGPDMCDRCAQGFVLKDYICVNEKTYVSYSDVTRYLTYFGLCFATYIIFQNSPLTASAIGLCVAIYVSISEYMLGTVSYTNLVSLLKL